MKEKQNISLAMTNTLDTNKLFSEPEYALLRQSMGYSDNKAFSDKSISEQEIDCAYLIDIAEKHGLSPLLYLFLNEHKHSLPDSVLAQLRERYQANALRNRILTKELVEVLNLLNAHDIASLAYKGPSLALHAYGDLSQRQFGDLDILVNEDDVQKASELLRQRHYQRSIPELTPRQELSFIHTAHEHTFISPDQLIHIDLHWSLSNRRFPFQMPTETPFKHAQSCEWQGDNIDHIATQDLLLILCMHANKDLWRKLVWVCDIDRLIRKHDNIDWKLLVQQAKHAHCEKMLYMALRFAYDMLKTPVPDEILKAASIIAPINKGEKVLQISMRYVPPVKTYLQCMAVQPYILSTCDTWIDRFLYITRSLVTPTECDMMKFNIPPTLHFLYYFTTFVRKISFCTTRFFKRLIFNREQ